MLVSLSGSSLVLLSTLEQNKQFLLLDNVSFADIKDTTNQIDLLIVDQNTADQYPTHIKKIVLGTDIFIPFSIVNLASLIKAKLFSSPQYRINNTIFRPAAYSFFDDSKLILKLTEKEAVLIEYLIKKGASGATEAELLNNIWHYSAQIETSTVETHIYRLKNKLETIDLKELIVSSKKSYFINLAFLQ